MKSRFATRVRSRLLSVVVLVVMGCDGSGALDFRFYGAIFELGDPIEGNDIAALLNEPGFPDDSELVDRHEATPDYFTPENTSSLTSGRVEWPQDGPDSDPGGDSGSDNYGGAVSGILYPPVSGSYTFHVRSDDGSALWLNPAGPEFLDLEAVDPIATESGCCGGYELIGEAASESFQLEVGQGYAFEYLWKEGGGGDWFQVGWSLNGGPVQTIPAYYVQRDVRFGDANRGGITGGSDEEVVAEEGQDYCCIGVEFDKAGVARVQWQMDTGSGFVNLEDGLHIQGARSPGLKLMGIPAQWNNRSVRPVVDGKFGDEVDLEIRADDEAPEVVSAQVRRVSNRLYITVSEPIDLESIDLSKFRIEGEPFPDGTSVSLEDFGTTLVLVWDPNLLSLRPDHTYRVEIVSGAFHDRSFSKNAVDHWESEFFAALHGVYSWDFDGWAPPDWELFGNAEWRPTGGVDGGGFIALTDGAPHQNGAMKLREHLVGNTARYRISFMARIGDSSDHPGEGFSVNIASDIPDATYEQAESGFAGTGDPTSFPEGLSLNFDNRASPTEPDQGVGYEAKWLRGIRAFQPSPDIREGGVVTESTEGIPTIHRGDRWFPVQIELYRDATITMDYDGLRIWDREPIGWSGVTAPFFGLGARTGAGWQSHWIDELYIRVSEGDGIQPAPTIISPQPEDVLGLRPGESFTLVSGALGNVDELSYQWHLNGEPIFGANRVVYHGVASMETVGQYRLMVRAPYFNRWSRKATVSLAADLIGISATVAPEQRSMTLEYEGTLQRAFHIRGPYQDVEGAASPHSVEMDADSQFYRVRPLED